MNQLNSYYISLTRVLVRGVVGSGYDQKSAIEQLNSLETVNDMYWFLFVISAIGFVFCVAWVFVNRGSKFWQNNWERHVDFLEDEVHGPLYKVVMFDKPGFIWGAYPFSVSKINLLISYIVAFVSLSIFVNEIFRFCSWNGIETGIKIYFCYFQGLFSVCIFGLLFFNLLEMGIRSVKRHEFKEKWVKLTCALKMKWILLVVARILLYLIFQISILNFNDLSNPITMRLYVAIMLFSSMILLYDIKWLRSGLGNNFQSQMDRACATGALLIAHRKKEGNKDSE